jgi:reversibly glycosylated polypeptide/UDP-arabinopyranose mutase
MVSHGVWSGIPDVDAPTQLTGLPEAPVWAAVYPIPKGIFAPLCGMNIAFRRPVLPFAYWAPAARLKGAERFDDIWMGLYLKRACDQRNWAILSGGASVKHERASDVFKNLQQEARGIEINETLWRDLDRPPEGCRDFFEDYARQRQRWEALISKWLEESQPSTTVPTSPQA